MIRLDSVTIMLPFSDVSLNKSQFIRSTETNDQNNVISDSLKLKKETAKNILGLKSITARHHNDSIIIELSSKILKGQYYEMINQNTIESLVYELNHTGIINVSEDVMLSKASILKMDATLNLKPETSKDSIISGLSCLPVTDKYNVGSYNTSGNRGVVFAGRQTSKKERQIFYDKIRDIKRDKKLQKYVPYSKLYDQFKDVLRVECNLASFNTIRQYTGCKNNGNAPLLNEVLMSVCNPNPKSGHYGFPREPTYGPARSGIYDWTDIWRGTFQLSRR